MDSITKCGLTEQQIVLQRELARLERLTAYPNAIASPAGFDLRSNGPVYRSRSNPLSGNNAAD
jgi:hypothetical protein